jgi:hypothetical protein
VLAWDDNQKCRSDLLPALAPLSHHPEGTAPNRVAGVACRLLSYADAGGSKAPAGSGVILRITSRTTVANAPVPVPASERARRPPTLASDETGGADGRCESDGSISGTARVAGRAGRIPSVVARGPVPWRRCRRPGHSALGVARISDAVTASVSATIASPANISASRARSPAAASPAAQASRTTIGM